MEGEHGRRDGLETSVIWRGVDSEWGWGEGEEVVAEFERLADAVGGESGVGGDSGWGGDWRGVGAGLGVDDPVGAELRGWS